jgi:FkbM family methyltransferase
MDSLYTLIRQTKANLRAFGMEETLRRTKYFMGLKLFGQSFYQKPIINCILNYSKGFRTFIDIGANVGTITLAVSNLFERCIAVEPLPQTFSRLRLNVICRNINNVQLFPLALGEKEGQAYIYYDSKCTDSASLVPHSFENKTLIKVSTLDLILEESKVRGPYFIKIDVQGYELKVFKGGKETLSKECLIISEFWPYGLKLSGDSPLEYIQFVKDFGYKILQLNGKPLDDHKLLKLCKLGFHDRFVVTDLFFSRRDIREYAWK